VTGVPAQHGQFATGTFSGYLYEAPDAGTVHHSFTSGSYDVLY
jgi:hypothetical protein